MAEAARFAGDVYVAGTLSAATISPSAGAVTNTSVTAAAADRIVATKLEHQQTSTYGQSGTATSVTIPIHTAYGTTGDVISFRAGSIAIAVGNSTVTVDLKKNGTSILTSVITLDTGNAARVMESAAGYTSGTSYAAGDFFEIVIVATVGTGTLPTGLGVSLTLREDPA